MNQPSPVATEATTSGVAVVPSYEERIASVNETLDAELAEAGGVQPDPDAPAATETTDALTAGVTVEIPDAGAPVVDAEAAQRAAERRQRLDALAAKQREQVDRKTALAQADKLQRDLAAAQARAEAAEAAAAGRVDMSSLDEGGFFALAEAKGIKPEALSAWMQKAITSPEKTAEAAALKATQAAYDPKLAALEARIAKQDADLAAMRAAADAAASRAEEQRQTQAFLGMVPQSADRAPLAAKLLAADPDEFMQMAEVAAAQVPGQGPHALLDAIEEMLDGDGRKFAQKYANLYGLIPSQTSAPVQPTTRGAAMPKTVSNSLAQSRTALVDEQDFARLSLEERAAILKRP